ncbi:LytR/AlgR family response regulator transcription factor [Flagellimonas pacifica]|uniref:DNA-binding response regulator, LytR/AlgR family n=1 Tax=Flagellimonas pacifica TaxID=1247520 RepID=A0A285MTU4_9FLAO|nr:LytTR family DNA-binding domain-containing protein [Allomuricauda parva]SNZ00113.1 DNA-binding response regulator, LytR/AlgR family [Allomuricauda parva]
MKIVIVEKDPKFLNRLTKLLKKVLRNPDTIKFASTVDSAIILLKNFNPDIVFMCFSLKDGDAFDILRKVPHLNCNFFFTSGFNGNMQTSPENFSMSFLLRPFTQEKILAIINSKKNASPDLEYPISTYNIDRKFLVPTGSAHVAINTEEVIKCVADGNYTCFYLKDKKHLVNYPIKYYDSLLHNKGFFRINRSILINIGHITAIYKKEAVLLSTNEKIMVSRRNRKKLKKLIDHLS